MPSSEIIKSEPDTDGTVSIICEESADLPLLTSDSKYVFNESHEAEFVQYYKENSQEITKTAFLRHFSEKWHMSEHPLLRRLEEWIGKNYSFSTEYCTAKMTQEMLVFYLENRTELTEDEVLGAAYFCFFSAIGKKLVIGKFCWLKVSKLLKYFCKTK